MAPFLRQTLSRMVATARSPRALSMAVTALAGLLLFSCVRSFVLQDYTLGLRNDLSTPVTVQRLDLDSGAELTLAPGGTLVLRSAGRRHQLAGDFAAPATVTPTDPTRMSATLVVLGVFTLDGRRLGRLVLTPYLGDSFTMCLSATTEPPLYVGGAVRGGRHGTVFCPRYLTTGPPLP